MPGLKIGYLPQEPQLDPDQTVRHAVEQGIGGVLAAKARLEEVYAEYAEPDADFDKLAAEQAELRRSSPPPAPRTPTCSSSWPPTRCACRPGTRRSACCRAARSAASRCAACCCPSPTCCCSTSPTNHLDAESVDWLEQFLQRYPGTVVAITHDRYFLDNAAEWILELDRGSGIPGRATTATGWSRRKRASSRSRRPKTPT
jgi:sulfate-transporting ATPase